MKKFSTVLFALLAVSQASSAFALERLRCEAYGYFISTSSSGMDRQPLKELTRVAPFGADGWATVSMKADGIMYIAQVRQDQKVKGTMLAVLPNGLEVNSAGTFVQDTSGATIPDPSFTLSVGPYNGAHPESSPSLGLINGKDLRALDINCYVE